MNFAPGTTVLMPGSIWDWEGDYWGVVVCRSFPGKHVVYFPSGHTLEVLADPTIKKYLKDRSKASAAEIKNLPCLRDELPPFLRSYWMCPLLVPVPGSNSRSAGAKSQRQGQEECDAMLVGWDDSKREAIIYLRPNAPVEELDWCSVFRVSKSTVKHDMDSWLVDGASCIARFSDFPSYVNPATARRAKSGGGSAAGGAGGSSTKTPRSKTSKTLGGAVRVTSVRALVGAVKSANKPLSTVEACDKLPWRWLPNNTDVPQHSLKGHLMECGDKWAWQFPDPLYMTGPRVLVSVSNCMYATAELAKMAHDRAKAFFLLRYAARLESISAMLSQASKVDSLWSILVAREGDEGARQGDAGAGGPIDASMPTPQAYQAQVKALNSFMSVSSNMFFYPPATKAQALLMMYVVQEHLCHNPTYQQEMRVFGVNIAQPEGTK